MVASRRVGAALFSGPGAPSRCFTPAICVACVSANIKSVALSPVSFGLPGVVQAPPAKSQSLRKKLCSVLEPETGESGLPSRKSLHTPFGVFGGASVEVPFAGFRDAGNGLELFDPTGEVVMSKPKPTASRRVTVERLLTSTVE